MAENKPKLVNMEDNDSDSLKATEREVLTHIYNAETADKLMSEPYEGTADFKKAAEAFGMTEEEYEKMLEEEVMEMLADIDI